MGRFKHEAAAGDPVRKVVYLTEDEPDGCFYRFVPTAWGDLSAGRWRCSSRAPATRPVHLGDRARPDGVADGDPRPGRRAKHFNGGEGCHYADDICWFTTKGDNRVWAYDTARTYEPPTRPLVDRGTAPLTGVDNITGIRLRRPLRRRGRRQHGDQPHHPGPDGRTVPAGHRAGASEITGPAFSPTAAASTSPPSAAPAAIGGTGGITYEITGPLPLSDAPSRLAL